MIRLFRNGTIYTGGGAFTEAFAVENGKILATGGADELLIRYPWAEKRDLRGAFVCAGFNDSHMHALGCGALLSQVDLSLSKGSLSDMLCALSEGLTHTLAGSWLIARGWNEEYFADGKRFPTRLDLDRVSEDVPICATRACGHVLAANSRAMALAGITRETRDPEGGKIDRDESGEPTGIFRENAIGLIQAAQPVPDLKRVRRMLKTAVSRLNARGITSVQTDDFASVPGLYFETILRAYADLASAGELTAKIYEQVNLPNDDSFERFLSSGLRTGAGEGRFRIGPVKLLADGSLGARTAYLSAPYADQPDTRGIPIYSQPRLNALVRRAHEAGMQIAVHCIGDAALDRTLEALECAFARFPREDARHGIVHCQITRPEQLRKMAEMKLHAYIQPVFLDYDTRIVRSRAGDALAASSYAFRTLYETCAASGGSDCPVEPPSVLAGIQCAVTRAPINAPHERYRPEEALSVAEAIDCFTINGARASFEEFSKGRIAPGMAADFTILETSPFTAYPARIADIGVMETWLDGEKVYDAAIKEEE